MSTRAAQGRAATHRQDDKLAFTFPLCAFDNRLGLLVLVLVLELVGARAQADPFPQTKLRFQSDTSLYSLFDTQQSMRRQ